MISNSKHASRATCSVIHAFHSPISKLTHLSYVFSMFISTYSIVSMHRFTISLCILPFRHFILSCGACALYRISTILFSVRGSRRKSMQHSGHNSAIQSTQSCARLHAAADESIIAVQQGIWNSKCTTSNSEGIFHASFNSACGFQCLAIDLAFSSLVYVM